MIYFCSLVTEHEVSYTYVTIATCLLACTILRSSHIIMVHYRHRIISLFCFI
jgi:hypothetical protein